MYSSIPYRFPAALELEGLGPLSTALVCRTSWESPAVLAQRDLLLGHDVDRISEYIIQWRVKAKERAIATIKRVFEAEKDVFGERSFFYMRERGLSFEDCLAVAADDYSEEAALDRTEGLDLVFAEEGTEE